MIEKTKEKQKAIALRKKGLSYNEILKRVPVAKSTLSLWLRDIGLAKRQKQRLTEKRRIAQIKAQQTCRDNRIKTTKEIKLLAKKEIQKLSRKELWLIGVALYWAEGSKQKETNVSQEVSLGNSDPNVVKIFLKWLMEICLVQKKAIHVRLYIHRIGNEKRALNYWSKVTKIPTKKFQKTVFKKHNVKTNRKVDNRQYFGLLDVGVRRSTNLNRKIAGWIEGISQNY
jgi:hypothetical protein